jgi:hypothetical protein
MAKWLVKRQLSGTTTQLRALREELRIVDEQFGSLADDADDDRLRSMVSESPFDARESRDSGRHAAAMGARRSELVTKIAALERRQDELLDQFSTTKGTS